MKKTYTDDTPMPWGKHKGIPIGSVPHDYLLWLFRQDWIKGTDPDIKGIHAYLVENQTALLEEEQSDDDKPREGFDSYDDYVRYGR